MCLRLWPRSPLPHPLLRFFIDQRGLIHLARLAPATAHHRQPLLREAPLRWPRAPSRDEELLAHTLRQQEGEAFTKSCAANSKPSWTCLAPTALLACEALR